MSAPTVAATCVAFGVIELDATGRPGPIEILAERADAEARRRVPVADDGRRAALVWNVAGRSELDSLDTATGAVTPGPPLPVDVVGGGDFSPDGTALALAGTGAARPTDISLIDLASGAVTQRHPQRP